MSDLPKQDLALLCPNTENSFYPNFLLAISNIPELLAYQDKETKNFSQWSKEYKELIALIIAISSPSSAYRKENETNFYNSYYLKMLAEVMIKKGDAVTLTSLLSLMDFCCKINVENDDSVNTKLLINLIGLAIEYKQFDAIIAILEYDIKRKEKYIDADSILLFFVRSGEKYLGFYEKLVRFCEESEGKERFQAIHKEQVNDKIPPRAIDAFLFFSGVTSLISAVLEKDVDQVKRLFLEQHANMHRKNCAGVSAFDIAVKEEKQDVVTFFR